MDEPSYVHELNLAKPGGIYPLSSTGRFPQRKVVFQMVFQNPLVSVYVVGGSLLSHPSALKPTFEASAKQRPRFLASQELVIKTRGVGCAMRFPGLHLPVQSWAKTSAHCRFWDMWRCPGLLRGLTITDRPRHQLWGMLRFGIPAKTSDFWMQQLDQLNLIGQRSLAENSSQVAIGMPGQAHATSSHQANHFKCGSSNSWTNQPAITSTCVFEAPSACHRPTTRFGDHFFQGRLQVGLTYSSSLTCDYAQKKGFCSPCRIPLSLFGGLSILWTPFWTTFKGGPHINHGPWPKKGTHFWHAKSPKGAVSITLNLRLEQQQATHRQLEALLHRFSHVGVSSLRGPTEMASAFLLASLSNHTPKAWPRNKGPRP